MHARTAAVQFEIINSPAYACACASARATIVQSSLQMSELHSSSRSIELELTVPSPCGKNVIIKWKKKNCNWLCMNIYVCILKATTIISCEASSHNYFLGFVRVSNSLFSFCCCSFFSFFFLLFRFLLSLLFPTLAFALSSLFNPVWSSLFIYSSEVFDLASWTAQLMRRGMERIQVQQSLTRHCADK